MADPGDTSEDDDDLDINNNNDKEKEYIDGIGDVIGKLEDNKLIYHKQSVDQQEDNEAARSLTRIINESFDKFLEKVKRNKNINNNNYDFMQYPRKQRFCTIIDRRKYISTLQMKKRTMYNDDGTTYYDTDFIHKQSNRNKNLQKPDDIMLFIYIFLIVI